MEAALLPFHRHVVLDLETTGLDPRFDEVIELGAVFLEAGRPVHRLSRLFAPSRPLPPTIQRITGLRDEDLAGRSSFQSYLPELQAALAGWTVVAHNAAFEQSFLSELLAELRAPILDTCELLHYLYPELVSHSLDALVRWAQVGTGTTHRALRDCEDTIEVVRVALHRCLAEDRTEEIGDLLEVLSPREDYPELGSGGPQSPLVQVLEHLQALCAEPRRRVPSDCSRPRLDVAARQGPGQWDHDQRAARAYLGAFLRRSPDGDLDRISCWFRDRFPALEELLRERGSTLPRSERRAGRPGPGLVERGPNIGGERL